MATSEEVFRLVREYLPHKKLRGKGITLDSLREALVSEGGLSKDVAWGLTRNKTIIEDLSPQIQDLVLAYTGRRTEDRQIRGVLYYRIEMLLGMGDLPYPDPQITTEYLESLVTDMWRSSLESFFMILLEGLPETEKYLDWAIEKAKTLGEDLISSALKSVIISMNLVALDYILKKLPKEMIRELNFLLLDSILTELSRVTARGYEPILISHLTDQGEAILRRLIEAGLTPYVSHEKPNRDWFMMRVQNLLRTTKLSPPSVKFFEEVLAS